eukprot:365928-Chlamydomonas_euryale.AAC.5
MHVGGWRSRSQHKPGHAVPAQTAVARCRSPHLLGHAAPAWIAVACAVYDPSMDVRSSVATAEAMSSYEQDPTSPPADRIDTPPTAPPPKFMRAVEIEPRFYSLRDVNECVAWDN